MKKAIIILAVILTTGLTALSVTKNESKPTVAKASMEKMTIGTNTTNVATAD